MKEYKYVLFDLDGTLTDPKEGITKSVAYALESYGIHVENLDSLCKFIGPPLRESFVKFYGFSEEEAEKAVAKFREYFRPHGVYENKMFEGVDKLLENLVRCGKQVVLATSKPEVFAKVVLEHFDLAKYFTYIAGSDMAGLRDRKADVIAYALSELDIQDKAEAVMVGDREHDIIGAKENGLDSIGVLYGFGDRAEHEAAGADYIVETVEALGELLQ